MIVLSKDDLLGILRTEHEAIFDKISSLITKPIVKRLNAKEASSYLGVSLSTLYKRVKEIPHKKYGKKLVFSQTELDQVKW